MSNHNNMEALFSELNKALLELGPAREELRSLKQRQVGVMLFFNVLIQCSRFLRSLLQNTLVS